MFMLACADCRPLLSRSGNSMEIKNYQLRRCTASRPALLCNVISITRPTRRSMPRHGSDRIKYLPRHIGIGGCFQHIALLWHGRR